MKLTFDKPNRWARARGFTMVEAMIASTILVLIIGSVVLFNLWGLAMATRQQIWLDAGDDARNALRMLHEDIRTAQVIYVGTGGLAGFTNVGTNTAQAGNAMMCYPSTNINNWVLYYWDPVKATLFRTNYTGTTNGDFKIVSANPITNDYPIFTMVDYLGNTLTNSHPYPMISVYLSFVKLQNPQVLIAPGSPVDFYQIKTEIADRQRP